MPLLGGRGSSVVPGNQLKLRQPSSCHKARTTGRSQISRVVACHRAQQMFCILNSAPAGISTDGAQVADAEDRHFSETLHGLSPVGVG